MCMQSEHNVYLQMIRIAMVGDGTLVWLECGLKLCFVLLAMHAYPVIASSHHQSLWENPYSHPYFDNSTKRDVTITVGQTANLPCRVRNLGDRAVSWIRKHDLHIITIGIMTYTNDQRFQAVHPEGSDEWVLKISSGQPRDSGIYECQVSTEPKISLPYRLTVVVAKAKILANSELFFKSGSDINLTCVSLQASHPPSFIYWYKDGYLINYSQRGGINVLTERQTRTSTLVISRAVPPDSGNYTCFPSNTNSDSVLVHVIKNEHRAAMQHENNAAVHCAGATNFIRLSDVGQCSAWLRQAAARWMMPLLPMVAGVVRKLLLFDVAGGCGRAVNTMSRCRPAPLLALSVGVAVAAVVVVILAGGLWSVVCR